MLVQDSLPTQSLFGALFPSIWAETYGLISDLTQALLHSPRHAPRRPDPPSRLEYPWTPRGSPSAPTNNTGYIITQDIRVYTLTIYRIRKLIRPRRSNEVVILTYPSISLALAHANQSVEGHHC